MSSLRSYIEAVGGKLKIVAEFPEGEVAITNFSDVGEAEDMQIEVMKMRLNHRARMRISKLINDPISALDAYHPRLEWKMDLHKCLIERQKEEVHQT